MGVSETPGVPRLSDCRHPNPFSPSLSGNSQRKRRQSSRLGPWKAPRSSPRNGRREEARGGERPPVLFQRGFLHFLAGSCTQTCLFVGGRSAIDCSGGGGEGRTKIICPAVRLVSCACVCVRECLSAGLASSLLVHAGTQLSGSCLWSRSLLQRHPQGP